MISFLSSLLVMASISTNALGAISTSNNSTNLKTNNNFLNTNSIDLSKINASVKNTWVSQSVWNQFQLQNANINLDYHTFNPELKTMSWKQVILSNITKGIDYHYNTLENNLYKQGSIFTSLLYQNQIWITILGQKNASLALNNNNSNILKPFWEPNKEISTFYLRVSNNNSMNWNVNHSYLDVTLNICNFQYDNYYWTKTIIPRFVASINYNNVVSNFNQTSYTYVNNPIQQNTIFSRSGLSTNDISLQLNSWSNANNFIDYYTFSAKIGTYISGITPDYKNYYNQSKTQSFALNYNSTPKQGANYFFDDKYNKITSKVTNASVYANEYASEIYDLGVGVFGFYKEWSNGDVVFDMSFPSFQSQSVDKNLYLSLWFIDSGNYKTYFYIKVTAPTLNMYYNTNVFDNIYKI